MKSRAALIAFFAAVAALLWFTLRSTADVDTGEQVEATDVSDASSPRAGFGAGPKGTRSSKTPVWERPSATVSGRVVDEDDQPVGGAQVCAFTSSRELGLAMRRDVPCTKSGADGRFTLGGLHPVRYSLGASAPQYVPATWRNDDDVDGLTLSAGEHRKDLVIALESGGVQIHGVVKDISGGEIEGALVTADPGGSAWFGRGGMAAVTRSDANGKFSLWVRRGGATVSAQAEGYAAASQGGATPGHAFEIFLSPESVLVGRIVQADTGAPVEGARVSVRGNSGFFGFDGGNNSTLSDRDGHFVIDRLDPGAYKVRASSEHGYGTSEAQVHLGLGEQSDEVVVRLHPASTVYGRIVVAGADGEPCTQGWVSVESEDNERRANGSTKPDGSVELRGLTPGTYSVDVSCDDYKALDHYDDFTVETGGSLELTWEVEEGRAIEGRVLSADGEPIAKAWVRATPQSLEGRAQRTSGSERTRADGTFVIRGLLPGEYELRASAPHDEREGKASATITEASDAEATIELPAGATVRGVVVDEQGDPVASVSVRDKGPTQGWSTATTDDEGRFEFTGLAVGQHRFYATEDLFGSSLRAPGTSDDDIQGVTVELGAEEDKEITITVESQGGEISGRVVDEAGGPIVDAFIRADRESDSATAGVGNNRAQARWGGWFDTPVLTDQDGRFTLTGLAEDASFTIYAHRKGGGEGLTEHVAAGSSGVEIAIKPTGSLSGKVTLADGSAPVEVNVNVHDKVQGILRSDRFYRTDGVFRFENLPAGKYEIIASTAKGDATVEKELAEGAKVDGIELQLTSRVTVKGRVIDADSQEPISGMRVTVQKDGGSFTIRGDDHGADAKHITDDDGRFEVERAATGEVTLLVMPRSFGGDGDYTMAWMKRTIPDEDPAVLPDIEMVKKRLDRDEQAGELGFKLKEGDAGEDWNEGDLTVAFVRPGGPADDAGLAVGDVIESVDGHDVTGENKTRYYTLSRVKVGTKLSLGLTGARTVELVAGKPL